MTVYDMPILALYAECIEYAVAHLRLITQSEVSSLFLLVRLFICQEITFKGGHL